MSALPTTTEEQLRVAEVRIKYLVTNIEVLAAIHEQGAKVKRGTPAGAADAEVAALLRGAVMWTDPMIAKALQQATLYGELVGACEAALKVIPGLEVRSWPPGFELKARALSLLKAALSKHRGGA